MGLWVETNVTHLYAYKYQNKINAGTCFISSAFL